MTFADDDLKRFKEWMEGAKMPLHRRATFRYLLARLEAAEKVCKKAPLVRDTVDLQDDLVEWRKAAERDEK